MLSNIVGAMRLARRIIVFVAYTIWSLVELVQCACMSGGRVL